ncbi:MAG: CHRD domain-containing protein [Nitrososphaeraceae archaeon]|nr:CHRD domain-containing protein [Nitrososphaeraceae archaeon]MDW0284056.1 CHRD domain-containing protein [Nitrososphaeraceae archaeon]MDW3621531.1 CHRD domain-containing protein [Nitrososphaeraceae archaeon]
MNNSSYLVAAILNVLAFILTVNVGFAQVSYRTDLVGEAEVPPLFSESTGSALIAGNDSSLKFQINVTSLDKVTSVSLYKGDDSENGQVLVSLLNSTEPSGLVEGKLVEGTINSSSILAPLANLTTNVTLNLPAPGNMSNLASAVPAPGNMSNLTSGFGNTTNLTTNSGNMTSPAAPVSKLEALIDLMNQNMTYINIHTSQFPEGELRGTLVPTNSTG